MKLRTRSMKTAAALGVLLLAAATIGRTAAGGVATVKFVNKSGFPNDRVYLYVIGTGPGGSGYLNWSTGAYATPRSSAITDMTTTLKALETTDGIAFSVPPIDGGRIFFSYGSNFDALSFDPATTEPGYGPQDRLLYDKVEFYSNDTNLINMNTTNVDFWSLPITFEAVDKNSHQHVTFGFQTGVPGIRNVIFKEFKSVPEMGTQETSNSLIFRNNLVQADTGGMVWRVVAPDKVAVPAPSPIDPASGGWNGNFKYFSYFWNDYVKNQCWIPDRTVTLHYNSQTYVGVVNSAGTNLSWTPGGEEYARPAWATKPTGWPTGTEIGSNYGHVIFGGVGEFTTGLLAPVINSAIQRGTMHLMGSEWFTQSLFYQGTNAPDSPVHHYGKILHRHSIGGQCYALSYDDGGGYNTSIYVSEGGVFTITLLPFARPPGHHDYDGNGTSDIAVFRGSAGMWSIRNVTRVYLGNSTDQLVPGDYHGDGTTDITVYRESSGMWSVRNLTRFYLGSSDDQPVPGDYTGNGTTEAGIFRPSSSLWSIRNATRVYLGGAEDTAVPGYYDNDYVKDIAVFRPSTGLWSALNLTRFFFGSSTDQLVPGDYNGAGRWEAGVFRPDSSLWSIRNLTRFYLGSTGDRGLPADYDGDGIDDAGIFRDGAGMWSVRNLTRVYFGATGDIPVVR